jgi:hypothetical protein
MQYHVIQKSYYIRLAIKVIAIAFTGAVLASIFLYYLTWKMLSITDLIVLELVGRQIFFQALIAFLVFSIFIVLGYDLAVLLFFISSVAIAMLLLIKKITSPIEMLNNEIKRIKDGSLNLTWCIWLRTMNFRMLLVS